VHHQRREEEVMAEAEAVETIETDGIQEMQDNVNALKSTESIVDDVTTDEEVEDVEYTDTEIKAMEKGWSPDKDNLPEGKEWIGAGEFVRNERLYNEIHKLKRETQATKRDFEVLKEHHKKVQVVERDKLLTQLKRQKKTALEEDDHDTVIEIDDQIADIKADANKPDEVEVATGDNAQFVDWVGDNQWYEENAEMRETADEIGAAYYSRTGGNAAPQDMYKYVEERIKKLYPTSFAPKQVQRKAPAVEAATPTRAAKAKARAPKHTAKDLNDVQRRVMRTFVKDNVMTEQEYIKELVAIGEL